MRFAAIPRLSSTCFCAVVSGGVQWAARRLPYRMTWPDSGVHFCFSEPEIFPISAVIRRDIGSITPPASVRSATPCVHSHLHRKRTKPSAQRACFNTPMISWPMRVRVRRAAIHDDLEPRQPRAAPGAKGGAKRLRFSDYNYMGPSGIENLHSVITHRTRNGKRWRSTNQRHRWFAAIFMGLIKHR